MRATSTAGSNLGFALMGLLDQAPRSGYDLRKAFTITPLAHFSDSPGAIYPALRRLLQQGWIEPTASEPDNARRRQTYRLSRAGRRAFLRWLETLPSRAQVVRDMDGLLLRFALMSQALPAPPAMRFLAALRAEVLAYIVELEWYLGTAGSAMTLSGRLAFAAGVEGYQATVRWTRKAERQIRAASRRPRRDA